MPGAISKPVQGQHKIVMESAPSDLQALNDYFKDVKDTARIRGPGASGKTGVLFTRTGTVFGRFSKWLTSRSVQAKTEREEAKKLIRDVLNPIIKDGDEETQRLAGEIQIVLDKNDKNLIGRDIDTNKFREALRALAEHHEKTQSKKSPAAAILPNTFPPGDHTSAASPASSASVTPDSGVTREDHRPTVPDRLELTISGQDPATHPRPAANPILTDSGGRELSFSSPAADPIITEHNLSGADEDAIVGQAIVLADDGEENVLASPGKFDGDVSEDRNGKGKLTVPPGATVACWRKVWQVGADVFIMPRNKLLGQSPEAAGNANKFEFLPGEAGKLAAHRDGVSTVKCKDNENAFVLAEDPALDNGETVLANTYRKYLEAALAAPDPSGEKPRALVLVPFHRVGGAISKEADADAIARAVTHMIARDPGLSIQVITNNVDMKNQIAQALAREAQPAV